MNEEKKIVGIGYNGMPNGCSDDVLPWRRSHDDWLETKYPYGEDSLINEKLVNIQAVWNMFSHTRLIFLTFKKMYSLIPHVISPPPWGGGGGDGDAQGRERWLLIEKIMYSV